jgi:hypothetical protein
VKLLAGLFFGLASFLIGMIGLGWVGLVMSLLGLAIEDIPSREGCFYGLGFVIALVLTSSVFKLLRFEFRKARSIADRFRDR